MAVLRTQATRAAEGAALPTIAVIDIGSNTVRLVEYEVIGRSGLRVIRAAKEVPRLGHGIDAQGRLSRTAIEQGVRSVRRLVTSLPTSRTRRTIAVATSAVRDAPNQATFVARVASVAGIRPRVLTGAEEARYGKDGVAQAWRLRHDIVVDLGGGSMQVVYVRAGAVAGAFSLPLGTVRLTDRFLAHDPPREREIDELRTFVERALARLPKPPAKGRVFLVGGTARALARASMELTEYPLRSIHGYPLRSKDLKGLWSVLGQMPADRRREVPGVDRTRADVILAGIATLREIGERFGVDDMVVSAQGIRDGIAYEAAGIPPPRSVDELINRSAVVSARSFRFPVDHGVEVERLATDLFDAVRRRFGWGPEERYAVRAAALHHDIGTTVATWHHALHSAYILRHTPLLGLTHRSAALAVLAVSRHEGEPWPEGWRRSWRTVLSDEDLLVADRLGTILFVAERLSDAGVGFRLATRSPRLVVTAGRAVSPMARLGRLEKHIRRGLGLGFAVDG
jgi:exopolyphosphatase/guanosine-5'-triphosphate,3'-diphosphate pyrophosphatase